MTDETFDDDAVTLALARAAEGPPAPPALRDRVLEFADLPPGSVDKDAYQWHDLMPGIRVHVVREDAVAGVRKVLVWARPGAVYPSHRHLGRESILVLEGGLRDSRGDYGPGDIVHSDAGSIHSEEALPGEDCLCFVVYHGEHEFVGGNPETTPGA